MAVPKSNASKDAAGIANCVDPDQTAPLGAVWSGSALFAQAYLSENLWSLQCERIPCTILMQTGFVKVIKKHKIQITAAEWLSVLSWYKTDRKTAMLLFFFHGKITHCGTPI